jgi:TonB family protein
VLFDLPSDAEASIDMLTSPSTSVSAMPPGEKHSPVCISAIRETCEPSPRNVNVPDFCVTRSSELRAKALSISYGVHIAMMFFVAVIHFPTRQPVRSTLEGSHTLVTILYAPPKYTSERFASAVVAPPVHGAVHRRPLALPQDVDRISATTVTTAGPSSVLVTTPFKSLPVNGVPELASAPPISPRLPTPAGFPGVQSPSGTERGNSRTVSLGTFSAASGSSRSTDTSGGTGGEVRVAGFPGVSTPVPRVQKPLLTSPTEPSFERAMITEVPKPAYTELARNQGIEGFVRLIVVFKADGHVVVTGIAHSLGYGLDETATAAVTRIKFQPAREAGKEVDQTGIVDAVFSLAYQTLTASAIK